MLAKSNKGRNMQTKWRKKIISRLVLIVGVLLLAVACSNTNQDAGTEGGKKKVTVTTSFIYDMVSELAGDKVETNLIIPHGEDPTCMQLSLWECGKGTHKPAALG